MSATPAVNAAARLLGENTGVPASLHRPLAASAQVGRGQFVTVDLSTGFASLNDGTKPNLVAVGLGDPSTLSDTSTVDGQALVRLSQRWIAGLPASTGAGDSFADTDLCKPFWIADENTPGKKSNLSGNNRSLGGIFFGLGEDGNPILGVGPLTWLLARATLLTDAKIGGSHNLSLNAGTDVAELAIMREKLHGVVTAVEYVGAAIANDANDTVQITVKKRDGAGGAAVTVATYDSTTGQDGAATAFVPKAFTLSAVAGALNLLETDILTITVGHAGNGKAVSGNVRLIQKVI
jgi:hypothetical protein